MLQGGGGTDRRYQSGGGGGGYYGGGAGLCGGGGGGSSFFSPAFSSVSALAGNGIDPGGANEVGRSDSKIGLGGSLYSFDLGGDGYVIIKTSNNY